MINILIVDDEPAIAAMYKIAFSQQKYLVELAVDGKEAVNKTKDQKPSLVLLDFMLPQLNGLEVLQQIKRDPDTRNIPVIMLTNLNDIEIQSSAMQAGAAKYLLKSNYTPMQLVEEVRLMLQSII